MRTKNMPKIKKGALRQKSGQIKDVKKAKKAVELRSMIKNSKPKRNRKGKIIKAAEYQNKSKSGEVSRVDPNRKWFGNTRVISQEELQKFINNTAEARKDPYKVIIKPGKLPFSLLLDHKKSFSQDVLKFESFEDTFGSKSIRNKPKIAFQSIEELAASAANRENHVDSNLALDDDKALAKDTHFRYGQSKRIWSELHKVIDSSDVLFQVIDARNPMGTRSSHIEKYLKKNKAFKHVVLILNKCDLIPTSKSWVYILSKEYPTIAFRSGLQKAFGKAAVFSLLRQFSKIKRILGTHLYITSVGFIGYPNVGKSSVINTLVGKKACNVAPIPGETKVWQYISLMKRIYLIDSPGVVYPTNDSESEIIMKGVVRAEYIEEPSQYISAILEKVKPEYLTRTYGVMTWNDSYDFLNKLALKSGRLLKGGEPDIETVSKMIISDFQRGKLPYFVPPPSELEDTNTKETSINDDPTIQIPKIIQPFEEIVQTAEF